MKGKKLSKALAFLLAVVMVFTTLPMFAFAEDKPYVVSYGSPAILMNENTWVNLGDIYVEMDAQGTTVSGAEITWSAAKQDGITFNAAKKLVNAKAAGQYKLVATANGVAKNVWVIVKKAEETEFTLVDYDFTVDKYDPTEWTLVYYAKDGGGNVGTAKATDGSNPAYFTDNSGKANGYILVGPNNGAETNASGDELWINHGVLINNNEMFNDFADYKIVSKVLSTNNRTNDWTGVGPAARVKLSDAGVFDADQNSILSFIMRNSTVRVQSHRGSWWANGIKTYEGTLVNREEGATDLEKYLWSDGSTYYETTGIFNGDSLSFAFGDTVLFNLDDAASSVKTEWAKDTNYAVQAGCPGVVAWGGGARIRTFTVKLLDNTLAPTTEVVSNTYKVSDAAPAIPMTAGKAVLLSDIEVNFDGIGYVALADAQITVADETKLTVSGDYLVAFAEGTHKIAVKYGDETKNVWVVAANETDAANNTYYLLNETFDDGTYDPDEWGVKVLQKDFNTAYYQKADGAAGSTADVNGKWYNSLYYQNGIFVDATAFTQSEVTELPATGAQKIIYKLTAASGNYEAGLYAWHFGKYVKANELTSADGTSTVIHYYIPPVFAYNYVDAVALQLLNATDIMPARYGAVIPFRTSTLKSDKERDALADENGNVIYGTDGVTPLKKTATDIGSFRGTGFFYSKNPIFNDFSDYTLETSTALVERATFAPDGSVNAAYIQMGPVARLTYDDTRVNDYAGFNISYRWANGGKAYYSYAKAGTNPSSGTYGTSTQILSGIWNINTALGTTEYYWQKKDETFVVSKMVASGNKVILEKIENRAGTAPSTAITYTQETTITNKGTVGVMLRNEGAPAIDYIKVTLNADLLTNKPEVYDPPIYNVDDNTPVIPMTAHSSTSLANIRVKFDGNAVSANAAEWVSKSNQLKFENGNAIVYGAGTYTATATYNGETKTIYFVAKNKDDEHYVVYGADFDRDVGNDWTLYDNSFNVLDKTDVFNDTSNYEMFNGFTLAQNRYLMLDNEIIRNLRDYTMSVEFGYSGTMSDNSWGCLYLLGRADVAVPTADFNTAMVGFMPRLTSTPIRLFYKNNAYNTNCKDTAETDYIYTVGDLVEATVKLNDKQVIATIDGVEIYDTLKDSDYSATKRDRLPVTGGNVGLKASYTYAIKRYEVRLNAETVAGAPECVALSDVVTDTIYMTEGTRLAMSDVKLVFGNETVSGDKAKWSYVRNDVTEVSDFFKTVCAFTEGSENITATYNGKTINLAIVVEGAKSANTYPVLTSMIETDGNGTAVIKPVADDNYAYQIAITPNAGYVVDTDKSYVYSYKTTIKMLGRTADSTGNTLVADFDDLSDVVVNLAFKADDAFDATMLGTSIRYADAETGLTNGIRFGMRSYNVKNKRITNAKIDGTEYKVVAVGMVMIPKPLLEGELTVNTKNARYKEFTSVVDSTANYADFAMVLTNLPEEYLTLDIASRGFIKYEISEGNYGYYYADELQSSFDKIEKRIESAELKYDFYYSDFDKGYVTMVYDDYRGDLGTVFNIFQEYNIPLVAAIPPETVTSDSKAVLLRNIQAAGGEIIGHHFTVLTSAMTSEQKFNKLKTTYDVLTSYGLNVNGYMLAGGTNQGDINRKEIETMLRKIGFSYSDLYGISPNYYHPRSSMATSNDSTIKKNITTAGNSKTWLSFYAHDLNTERTADELRELIEYIQANPNVEIVTYKYIYQNFGNFRNPVNWNNGVTQ